MKDLITLVLAIISIILVIELDYYKDKHKNVQEKLITSQKEHLKTLKDYAKTLDSYEKVLKECNN